jgi:DNA-binding transcriptional regulator YiaG
MTGDRLRELRTCLDLSVTDFAAAIGVSAQTVFNWESGRISVPKPVQKLIHLMWGPEVKEALHE